MPIITKTTNPIKQTTKTRLSSMKAKKPNKTYNVTIPVLKRKKPEPERKIKIEMPQDFKFDDFSKISFDGQTKMFNAIKNEFVNLREESQYMDRETFVNVYSSYLLELLDLAVTGNVAAMDYLCYVYKKGLEDFIPANLTLAHKWGMLAIANGSKLAVDRLRMFITPVFDYVEDSDLDIEVMMEQYDVPDGDAAYFVAEMFAGLYNPKMNITLLNMSKEDPTSFDSNFQKFMYDANQTRDEVLPELLNYLK